MIEAHAIRKSLGGREILRGVDLSVGTAKVACLLGPSGSGKSTFLRCVNRLETVDSGTLLVDGEVIGYRRSAGKLHELSVRGLARQRSRIGMVFQHFNLFPHMSVLQNVIEAPVGVLRRGRAEATDAALALLERVGLRDKAHSYPSELSGGQKQRVAIARALAMQPKLMLFDEPTSALDPELVGEVLAVMRDLARTGMTMLVVTHEMKFARDVADVVFILDAGRVIEQGPAEAVLSTPRHPRSRTFLSRVG